MMNKKRILFSGEASFLNTGFSTYYRELLPRLAATGKYILGEMGCIPNPWSQILMGDGTLRPIFMVRENDLVVTHTGNIRKVTNTFKKFYDGDLIKISRQFIGGKTLEVTINHPILVIKKDDAYKNNNHCFNKDPIRQWISANNISINDFVAYSFLPLNNNSFIDRIQSHDIIFDLDDDFAFLAGWFLSEGCVIKSRQFGIHGVSFCGSLKDELFILEYLKNIFDKKYNITYTYRIRKDIGVWDLKITNRPFAIAILSLFGSSSIDKFIDHRFYQAKPDFILKMMAALFEGDGGCSSKRNEVYLKTASLRLAQSTCLILNSLGIRTSLLKTISSYNGNSFRIYKISSAGEYGEKISQYMKYKKFDTRKLQREETITINNLLFSKVTQTHRRHYAGYVYNLEVEGDNSYICDSFVVHNSYATNHDPRIYEFIKDRWKFYGVLPETEEEKRVFHDPRNQSPRCGGQNTWQFGEGKLPFVAADFQNDILIDLRDWWMLEYQERSVFRSFWKWVIMPTVDSEPQKEEWIQTYRNADLVMAYSDFGVHCLKKYGGIKVYSKPMRPGVDIKTFIPRNRKELKEKYLRCKDDVKIITTTMRNQARKLFPDAIDAFAIMKEKYKGNPVVDKAILLLHSSWPDNAYSYDYPRHIERMHNDWYGLEYYSKNIKNSVMNTFLCHNCGHTFISWAINLYNKPIENRGMGPKIYIPCEKCGQNTATTPDTSTGYTREQLAEIYALSDIYIQVSIAEGDSMPCQEAKSCGTPILVTDYSAMSEKGRFTSEYIHLQDVDPKDYTINKGGDVIPIRSFYYEPETSCKRAHPDVKVLADLLFKYLTDDKLREKTGEEARQCVEENYDWDKLAKQWEYVLDNVKPLDRSETWDKPHEVISYDQPIDPPEGLADEEFIEFLYLHILKYPRVDKNGMGQWLMMLKNGQARDVLLNHFRGIRKQEIDSSNAVNVLLSKQEDKKGIGKIV